jgi:GxxExxY protein
MIEPPREVDVNANAIIGAALEVHRILGPGFLEAVYTEAMAVELAFRGIRFEQQRPVGLRYKGQPVGEGRLDFLIDDGLVLELKAVDKLLPIHHAQVLSYLKSTGCQLGLLINFNERLLRDGIRRVVLSPFDR